MKTFKELKENYLFKKFTRKFKRYVHKNIDD